MTTKRVFSQKARIARYFSFYSQQQRVRVIEDARANPSISEEEKKVLSSVLDAKRARLIELVRAIARTVRVELHPHDVQYLQQLPLKELFEVQQSLYAEEGRAPLQWSEWLSLKHDEGRANERTIGYAHAFEKKRIAREIIKLIHNAKNWKYDQL